ncbi:MAG: hypothetical protein HFACDABA_02132 [Anaerolineales bacterium]|nr:hypothetical protein [Anaerolineales bacterium]
MKRILISLLAIALLTACAGPRAIEVKNPWARAALTGENSAVYFEIRNGLSEADEVIGVSSEVAEAVEVHFSSLNADGVMQMKRQDSVPLEAGAEVTFAPGGLHVMLIGLVRDLNAGDSFSLTLHFKHHADLTLAVTVQGMEGMDMPGHAP